MSKPLNFSWVEPQLLAGHAYPSGLDDLRWLRSQGIQIILTLTEETLRKSQVDDAGLLSIHEPIRDFHAPTMEQLDRCVSVIRNALSKKMPVAIHCAAGMGRTGTVLTAWLISKGMAPREAIDEIRRLRPGSVETRVQVDSLLEWHQARFAAEPDAKQGATAPQGN
jgi:atypical dual specificity phosphatase